MTKNLFLAALLTAGGAVGAEELSPVWNANAAQAGWTGDPLAWKFADDAIVCRNTGFAFADAEQGREVTVSARVTPQACTNADWSTIGVAVFADRMNFWHLALVKHPEGAKGAQHSFELGMMLDGAWPVQGGLKCLGGRADGRWEFGRDYDLTLKMDAKGVRGEITEAGSGKRVYSAAYAFTAKASDRGRPALHVTGDFRGTFARLKQTVGNVIAAEKKEVPAYPSASAARAVAKPTGFFRVEERNGRWTAIDPNGAPFTVLGVDHVQPWGMFCESLGYSPYGRHVKAHYPDYGAWADETLSRLRSWGFNALGAGCDFGRLGHRGLVHTIFLSMGDRLCYGDGEWWIRKCLDAPCTAFPNVFHPDFARACDWVAAEKCAKAKDDPWLFGYFIDNELAWWGGGGLAGGMFDAVNALPADHAAKRALESFRAGRPVTPELKTEFLALVADRYFATATAAIRKHDPNHMILGCRFAGLGGAHDVVWRTAAKYCDIVTFNCYPWADLDRNVVLNRKGGVPVREKFDELYAKVSRPMLLTEWSFPALDTGRPCYHGAGQRFMTQDLRVQATSLFARTLLALPYFIGYDYFMWVDQPAPGMNHDFPEDSNYGLVQEDGTPHAGITSMFARLHGEVDRWRKAGVPAERAYTPPTAVSERERFVAGAKGPAEAVKFVREGDAWTLSNDAGLVLKGAVGKGKDMASSVILDGRRVGSLGGLVELKGGNGHAWIDVREVRDVRFVRDGVCGTVTVTADAGCGNARFALTLRFAVAPGERDFIGEIVSVRNIGNEPIEVAQLFLRPFAAERPEGEVPQVPKLWKGASEAKWRYRDGTTYGAVSHDPDAAYFRLWVDKGGGQHPDVAFAPSGPCVLKPGADYRPQRPMSARLTASLR